MKFLSISSFLFFLLMPVSAFACHPILKCVQPNGNNYIAYFGFEGGENNLSIGSKNKFSGANGCTESGKNCGQGTHFLNNGPYENDLFGLDSIVAGQALLPVNFSQSVTWTLSGNSVTATKNSKACASPSTTPTATATQTATRTITSTATYTPTAAHTATMTSTHTVTATRTQTSTVTYTPTAAATNTSTTNPTFTSTPTSQLPTVLPTFAASFTYTPTPPVEIQITDCEGVPGGNKVIDCCGVCGGDGTSCPELCEEIDNRPVKKKLRREVMNLTDSILRRIKQEIKCQRNNPDAQLRKKETQLLKNRIKILMSGFEEQVRLCDTPFCQKTFYTEITDELKYSVKKLVKIDKLSQRSALKVCCSNGACGGGKSGVKRSSIMNNLINEFPEASCN